MKKYEDGVFHFDDNGYLHFTSFNTIGGGILMIVIFIALTVLIDMIGMEILKNQWIFIFPAVIAVTVRTFKFDSGIPVKTRAIHIVSDLIKSVFMYLVVLVVVDELVMAHWLDRVFLTIVFGLILVACYFLLKKLFRFLRICNQSIIFNVLYFSASLAVAIVSVMIYFSHTWYWMGYDYKINFNGATIIKGDDRLQGNVEIPQKLNMSKVVNIASHAFYSNDKITSIKIPDGVKMIEDEAIYKCISLDSIYLPSTISKIQNSVIYECPSLAHVYYTGTNEQWNEIDILDPILKNYEVEFVVNSMED